MSDKQTSTDPSSEPVVSDTKAQAQVEGATAAGPAVRVFGTIEWPVPHIMVAFRDLQIAYGREGVAQLGRLGFKKELFATLLWKPWGNRSQREIDYDYERSTFAKTVILLGVFYAVHGRDDAGPVVLGNIGWEGMVQNLVSITVVFEDETEK
ncbi:hypothetical protein LXA43DRAFT_1064348 [Ganoderma leucocontextum]|nr:hypothetical protein LXA43DRAFT_1064348 [Ganoderma leucocontextum]